MTDNANIFVRDVFQAGPFVITSTVVVTWTIMLALWLVCMAVTRHLV